MTSSHIEISMKSAAHCRLAVVIASKGRPDELALWRRMLDTQTLKPSAVVFSVTSKLDLPGPEELPNNVIILTGPAGASQQRNRGIEAVIDCSDLIAFFDDDYVPAPSCFSNVVDFMSSNLDVAGANGVLLADGVNSLGISFDEAAVLISNHEGNSSLVVTPARDLIGLYGCNMVFRAKAIKDVRFDENLPLYSWQEDIDFAVRVGRSGRIVITQSFFGVHLGVKKSRSSGLKFGYSQIANPVYLIRKQTMPLAFGLNLMFRNFASNHIKMFRSEHWVDRIGRARGNWIAIKDLMLGKIDPRKVVLLNDD